MTIARMSQFLLYLVTSESLSCDYSVTQIHLIYHELRDSHETWVLSGIIVYVSQKLVCKSIGVWFFSSFHQRPRVTEYGRGLIKATFLGVKTNSHTHFWCEKI